MRIMTLFVLFMIFILNGCYKVPEPIGFKLDKYKLQDGTFSGKFTGKPVTANVNVTIKNSKIKSIDVIEHDAFKGKKAETTIIESIINDNSTNVDAYSGATISSRVLMNAVHKAVEKSIVKDE